MIMSTISSTADRRADAGGGILTMAAAATAELKRLWVAYMTWRVERGAIGLLGSMSDCELKDMGVTRSEIERLVKGQACERPCGTCSVADQCAAACSSGTLALRW